MMRLSCQLLGRNYLWGPSKEVVERSVESCTLGLKKVAKLEVNEESIGLGTDREGY